MFFVFLYSEFLTNPWILFFAFPFFLCLILLRAAVTIAEMHVITASPVRKT